MNVMRGSLEASAGLCLPQSSWQSCWWSATGFPCRGPICAGRRYPRAGWPSRRTGHASRRHLHPPRHPPGRDPGTEAAKPARSRIQDQGTRIPAGSSTSCVTAKGGYGRPWSQLGGFLGIGMRRIAVHWSVLRFNSSIRSGHASSSSCPRRAALGAGIQAGRAGGGARRPPRLARARQVAAISADKETRRPWTGAAGASSGSGNGSPGERTFGQKQARPRLVHVLRRQPADRVRPVPVGLSHHPAMDAGRHWPHPLRGQRRRPHRPGARRLPGRRGPSRSGARRRSRSSASARVRS